MKKKNTQLYTNYKLGGIMKGFKGLLSFLKIQNSKFISPVDMGKNSFKIKINHNISSDC